MDWEMVTAVIMGIGLAAACGFRVFVPMFIASIAVRGGAFEVTANFDWIGTMPAMVTFGTASVLEIAAYYVPWVDNLLDTIATPASVIAGSLMAATFITGMDPWAHYALAAILGGGSAGVVQLGTVAVRAASSTVTGGAGNHLVSTGEAAASTSLAVMALVAPVLALVLFMALAGYLIVRLRRRRAGNEVDQAQPVA